MNYIQTLTFFLAMRREYERRQHNSRQYYYHNSDNKKDPFEDLFNDDEPDDDDMYDLKDEEFFKKYPRYRRDIRDPLNVEHPTFKKFEDNVDKAKKNIGRNGKKILLCWSMGSVIAIIIYVAEMCIR